MKFFAKFCLFFVLISYVSVFFSENADNSIPKIQTVYIAGKKDREKKSSQNLTDTKIIGYEEKVKKRDLTYSELISVLRPAVEISSIEIKNIEKKKSFDRVTLKSFAKISNFPSIKIYSFAPRVAHLDAVLVLRDDFVKQKIPTAITISEKKGAKTISNVKIIGQDEEFREALRILDKTMTKSIIISYKFIKHSPIKVENKQDFISAIEKFSNFYKKNSIPVNALDKKKLCFYCNAQVFQSGHFKPWMAEE